MVATSDVAKFDTKHLFDKYLSTESPSEVNISSSLKTRISTLINVKNGCDGVEPSEIKHQELVQSLESAQAEVKVA
jgi:purine nucleoside phosphorylase